MRHDIAERITKLIKEYQGKLNASTLLVQETCSEEEFQVYRQAVGRATDFMWSELTKAMDRADSRPGSIPDFGVLEDFEDYEEYEGRTLKLVV